MKTSIIISMFYTRLEKNRFFLVIGFENGAMRFYSRFNVIKPAIDLAKSWASAEDSEAFIRNKKGLRKTADLLDLHKFSNNAIKALRYLGHFFSGLEKKRWDLILNCGSKVSPNLSPENLYTDPIPAIFKPKEKKEPQKSEKHNPAMLTKIKDLSGLKFVKWVDVHWSVDPLLEGFQLCQLCGDYYRPDNKVHPCEPIRSAKERSDCWEVRP